MRFSEPLKRIGMKPFGAATQPSVLQEPRALNLFQGSLAKQILTCYRLVIFRAGLPKKRKNQSQVLEAIRICPVRF